MSVTDKPTWLYAMRAGEHCKVGISNNVKGRAKALQTANPFDVSVLRTWGPFDRATALGVEAEAHDELGDGHTSGEWFKVDADELVDRTGCVVESWHLRQMFEMHDTHGPRNFRSSHLLTDSEYREMVCAANLNAAHHGQRVTGAVLSTMAAHLDGFPLSLLALRAGCADASDLHGELDYMRQLHFVEYDPVIGVLRFGEPRSIAPDWWAAKGRPES